MRNLTNIVLMQANWFACVLGAAHGWPWAGVAFSIALLAWHLSRAHTPRIDLVFVGASLALGLLLDSVLASGGWVTFASGIVIDGFTTPWMLALWLGFATTLTTSLAWLLRRPLLAILFGAIGGPAAYWSGAQLGALTLESTIQSLLAIGICWSIAMGFFVHVSKRVNDPAASEVLA